jgi:hypothetical protein
VKTPMIDRVLPMIEKRGDVDIVYGSKRFGTQAEFATELRALLAERERLAGEVTEWEGHAQTYEAGMVAAQRELAALKAPAPRRLREYKGVTYRDGRWHIAGKPFDNAFTLMYWYAEFVDADHAALMLLKEQPYESELEHRLRAWLATKPQTITPEQAVAVLVANGARRSSAKHAAMDSHEYAPVLILPTATPEPTP